MFKLNTWFLDHIEELKKLNKSLLYKFLELIDFLIYSPQDYKKKVEDVELLFVNMYHLLNCYRPHQARQILISLIQQQIEKRKGTIQSIDDSMLKVTTVFNNICKFLNDSKTTTITQNEVNNNNNNITTSTSIETSSMVNNSYSTSETSASIEDNKKESNITIKMLELMSTIS